MIRTILTAAALGSAAFALPVLAAAPAPTTAAATPAFSTAETPLGDMLDNASAKAVLQKHVPDLIGNAQIEMARSMTLKQLQNYAGDMLTDEKLAQIDADLAKLPAK